MNFSLTMMERSKRFFQMLAAVLVSLLSVECEPAVGQIETNKPPINYETTEPNDRVAALGRKLDDGSAQLKWEADFGWLKSLLEQLDVPTSSQTLVFSKTSKQIRRISPSSPRAIYFNDEVYVAFVPGGEFLEVGAVDPVQGAMFYSIEQENAVQPRLVRETHKCMSCHETSKTQKVPGFLVRSVFPKRSGHPEFRLGTTLVDHRTEFKDRFGGWYVTGDHGEMRHRGNVLLMEPNETGLDREKGANLQRLPRVVRKPAIEPTSDIVALMLLEHQAQFHNHVTHASYTARQALHHQELMNKVLERAQGFRSDTTKRRLKAAAEKLVRYLFFVDEFKLTSPVKGNSSFQTEFESKAVRSSDGESLRDLDLQTRLLKNPCSYLVYSESFCSLPEAVLSIVKRRMLEVLEGVDESEDFGHLSDDDRKRILRVLNETHPMFAK